MIEFFIKHKVFFIVLITVLVTYYTIFFAVHGISNKKNKKTVNNKKYVNYKDDVKNFIKLAPELDDIPVLEDEITPSGATSNNLDWEKSLEELKEVQDGLKHSEGLKNFLNDSGIDTED